MGMNVNIAIKRLKVLQFSISFLLKYFLGPLLNSCLGHTHSVNPPLHQQSGHEGNNLVTALITGMFAADAENIN